MIDHLDIERTANGFVLSIVSYERDYGRMRDMRETFVFNHVADLAAKVEELFKPEESKAPE